MPEIQSPTEKGDEQIALRNHEVSPELRMQPPSPSQEDKLYLQGIRYWMVSFLVGIMLFLVQTEISIVTTSLVAITQDLGGFNIASWVLSSYLLGYVGVVVIMAKASDIIGRKPAFVSSILVFTLFSAGCSAAMTMPQLIVLRAFQGMGGGASYALSTIMIVEIVPPSKYGKQVAFTGIAIVLAMVLGPIIGGAISSNTTWRWIFIFNVPIGALGLLLALMGIPNGFPNHGRPVVQSIDTSIPSILSRLDIPGSALVLLATTSFTAAFQEAGSRFSTPGLLVSVMACPAMVGTPSDTCSQHSRTCSALALLDQSSNDWHTSRYCNSGGPLTVTAFQLPQRFQLLNGLSGLDAGVRLIPFGAAVPFGTIASTNVLSKLRVPAVFVTIIGALLQVVGYALLGTSEVSSHIPPALYGYQVIAGVGCGVCFQTLFLAIPFTVEEGDKVKAVGLGTATQSRAMGSAIMISVTTSVFNGFVLPRLTSLGIPDPTSTLQGHGPGASQIPPDLLNDARDVLSEGYNRQMLVLSGCGAAQVFLALLMWRKKQIRIA
ncbi:MFS multidrug transporter-like protein [Apiospora arundinis]